MQTIDIKFLYEQIAEAVINIDSEFDVITKREALTAIKKVILKPKLKKISSTNMVDYAKNLLFPYNKNEEDIS